MPSSDEIRRAQRVLAEQGKRLLAQEKARRDERMRQVSEDLEAQRVRRRSTVGGPMKEPAAVRGLAEFIPTADAFSRIDRSIVPPSFERGAIEVRRSSSSSPPVRVAVDDPGFSDGIEIRARYFAPATFQPPPRPRTADDWLVELSRRIPPGANISPALMLEFIRDVMAAASAQAPPAAASPPPATPEPGPDPARMLNPSESESDDSTTRRFALLEIDD